MVAQRNRDHDCDCDHDFIRIAPDVKLGRDVKIFAFVNLYGCEIGDECKIGTFVEIQRGARLGRPEVRVLVGGEHDYSVG